MACTSEVETETTPAPAEQQEPAAENEASGESRIVTPTTELRPTGTAGGEHTPPTREA